MPTVEAFAEQDFASGSRHSAEFDLPAGEDRVELRVSRADLDGLPPNATILTVRVEVLVDAAWVPVAECGTSGGTLSDQSGTMTESHFSCGLPAWTEDRLVRVRLVTARPLRTAIDLTTDDQGQRFRRRPGAPPQSVAIDATGFVVEGGGLTSIAGDITVGNNSDRVLLAYLAQNMFDTSPKTVNAVTFNSDAMTVGKHFEHGNNVQQDVYYLLAPDVATGSLAWTLASASGSFVMGYLSAYGAAQSSTFSTWATNGAGNGSASSASLSVNCDGFADGLAASFFSAAGSDNPMTLTETDGTLRWERQYVSIAGSVLTEAGNAGGHTLASDGGGGNLYMGGIAVGIAPVAAGTAVPVFYHQRQVQGMAS